MADKRLTMSDVNAMSAEAFVVAFGPAFEHSPWIAEQAAAARPFTNVTALHAALMQVVRDAPSERQLGFLRGHPELAGREAQAGALTAESTGEQGRLGFDRLPPEDFARMQRLNSAYAEKFGFPCMIALRLHDTRATVFAEHESRLANDRDTEIRNCLDQVAAITRGRVDLLVRDGASP